MYANPIRGIDQTAENMQEVNNVHHVDLRYWLEQTNALCW